MSEPDYADRYYQSDDGLRLHYRDYAPDRDSTPVLCLPGLTRNCRDFEDLAPHLAERRRVLAPDLRGRGLSEYDPEWRHYHPGTYVGDVIRLLDTAGIERVVLIGTSLGGLIAMALAARDRGRLAAVVMNDVGPEIAPEGLARIQAYTGKLPPVSSWAEAAAQAKAVYGKWLPGLGDADWERLARRGFREGAGGAPELDMDPNIGRAVREVGPQTGDPWALFDALGDLPVLVLRGAMSDILSRDILERMHARKPDLESVEVANRGHVPLLDEPDALEAIDRFLDRY
jgi:pimeloyl-ACP methyl ester carboxylesterase